MSKIELNYLKLLLETMETIEIRDFHYTIDEYNFG